MLAQPRAHNITLPPERAQRVCQGFDLGFGMKALERHEGGLSKIAAGNFTIFDGERNLPNRNLDKC
jgi:hypothetical protein